MKICKIKHRHPFFITPPPPALLVFLSSSAHAGWLPVVANPTATFFMHQIKIKGFKAWRKKRS